MVALSFSLAVAAAAPATARGQDEPKEPAATVEGLPKPETVPPFNILPTLPTTPVRKGSPAFNLNFVDASLLPRDKQDIWVLDFAFKPLRLRTVEIPGKGRKIVHYLYYRVVNHTGQPRDFVPQFVLETDTGKRYEEAVVPGAVPSIQAREDPSIKVLGAVDIAGKIPPSTKQGVDDAVYGVAMWEDVDPKADRLSIYIRGLSNGWTETKPTDGGKPVVKYKTLRIDVIRRGDERNLNEKELELAEPPYDWRYW